jgi:trehalose 6-phosphate phosphatase
VSRVSVTLDPRRHDAVVFDIKADPAALVTQLAGVGLRSVELAGTEHPDSAALAEAVGRLHARAGRCVLITDSPAAVKYARAGGFALVVGLNPAEGGDDLRCPGADDVVRGLGEIAVRTGDQRMSQLPDATAALLGSGDSVLGDRRPAVFFDFDGTLSDIVDDPDTATLAAGAAEALQSLSAQCPVAVLSGRDLADVRQRIALPGIWYAGSHGFESVGPDGEHHQNDAAASAIPVLEDAAAEVRGQLSTIDGVVVERKRFGVAVHYRNARRDQVGKVLAAVRGVGQHAGLRVTTGREVVELRPDIDWDKGKTLRWVVDQISDDLSASLLPVYLGDDITDEDAFDAVLDDGIGIVVRHTDDGDRATAARYALDSPAQVSDFTGRLAQRIAANS